MNMAETLIPTRTAPPQGASRDTRVKDDGAAGAAEGGDDGSFRDVMADLADRSEGKRGSASASSDGAERPADGAQARSGAASKGTRTGADDATDSEADAGGDEAVSPVTSEALLAQMVLGMAPGANGAAMPVAGEMPAAIPAFAASIAGEQGAAQAAASGVIPVLGSAPDAAQAVISTDAQPQDADLAALSDGVEEVPLADLLAPVADSGSQSAEDAEIAPIKVKVVAQETHFAPVQSAEATLSRLLGAPVTSDADAASTGDATASTNSTDATAKSSAGALAAAVDAPAGNADGLSSGAQGGREGSGEKRLADGQTTTVADQQGARAGASTSAEFQAVVGASSAGQAGDTTPSAQIARRIAAELANPTSRPQAPASGSDGAVKVLHIQLEPANLGAVTVRLALKDNVINVQVEATRHETAFAIEKDREALSNALKSAGYVVDSVSAQPADSARPSFQAQAVSNDGQMSSSLQSRPDDQSGLAQSGGRNKGDEGRQSPERGYGPGGGNDGRAEGSRTSGGALYV